MLFDESLVLLCGLVEEDWSHGEHQEGFEEFQGVNFVNRVVKGRFVLEPSFFDEARPHVSALDRLTEEWAIIMTKNVVVDVHGSSPSLVDDVDCCDPVAAGTRQDDTFDQLWVICQVA